MIIVRMDVDLSMCFFSVVGILVLVMFIMSFPFTNHAMQLEERGRTWEIQSQIVNGLSKIYIHTGKWPSSIDPKFLSDKFSTIMEKNESVLSNLEKLSALPLIDGYFSDGWKRPLSITYSDDGRFFLRSKGEDGIINTKDDLISFWPDSKEIPINPNTAPK